MSAPKSYGQQILEQTVAGYKLPEVTDPKPPTPAEILPATQLPTIEPLTDNYGLAVSVFGRFPDAVRFYLRAGMRALGLPLDRAPGLVGFGTVPELCLFGLLLEHGYTLARFGFYGRTARSFVFQADVLGGRVPGGAVADFVVYRNGLTIPVRVQSVFHDINMPFGAGGRKEEEDDVQRYTLESQPYVTSVVDVNRGIDGYPLENGDWPAVQREYRRATYEE